MKKILTAGVVLMIGLLLIGMTAFTTGCSNSDARDQQGEAGLSADREDSEHNEEGHDALQLSDRDIEDFGIVIQTAGPIRIHREIVLPGEVRMDQNKVAHVMPTVPGSVFKLKAQEGDRVSTGQVLAVIHSRELAEAKAVYLDAKERYELARINFERISALHEERITSKEEMQTVQRELRSADIEVRSTEQTLHALGLDDDHIENLGKDHPVELSHHELRAPFDGVVISRSIVQGERVDETTDAFVVADLSQVWIDANVYPRDLGFIRKDQSIRVLAGYGIPEISGKISFVGPVVGEDTRTAIARSIVPNPSGLLRPGLFVKVKVAAESFEVPVGVPRSALVQMENKPHIFIQDESGFEAVEVILGMEDENHIEIVDGLTAGMRFVVNNAFVLKAEKEKDAFGDGHGH